MKRRTFVALAAFAAIPGVARADLGRPVRVGDAPGDPYAQAYWAYDTGVFRQVGLDVDLLSFTSGSQMSAAVIGGSLDIAITTPIQVANAHLRGVPLVIIAAGSINTPKSPGTVLIAAASGEIKGPKDLDGKTVAVNSLKTLSEVGLDAWLATGGVDPSRVHVVEMVMPAMGPAISRGAIQAGILNDPSLSSALKNDGARVLLDTTLSIAPRLLTSCWFCTVDFAHANPDIVRKYDQAMQITARWANTHKSESGEILAKYGNFPPDSVKSGLRAEFTDELRVGDIQPELDAAERFGALAGHVNAADILLSDQQTR